MAVVFRETKAILGQAEVEDFTRPSGVTTMLAGLRSRCTMPARAPPRAPRPLQRDRHAPPGRKRAPRSAARSVWPSTYSMTMKAAPSWSPKSYTVAMFG